MEDSNLSKVSSDVVSELPVTVNVSDESVLGQNPVEDSYVVENGGEIMVEIVGSDVFLDGVNERSRVVSQDFEVKCSESDGVREVSNLGNDTVDGNSSKVPAEAVVVVGEIGGDEGIKDDVVGAVSTRLDEMVDDDNVKEPVEAAVVVGEIGGAVGIKDDVVEDVSTRSDEMVDDDNAKEPVEEAVVVGEMGGTEGIKDDAVEDVSTRLNEMIDDDNAEGPVEAAVVVGEICGDDGIKDDAVEDVSTRLDENAKDPTEVAVVAGEIGVAEVDTDVKGIKDDAMDDEDASVNIVTDDKLNESVEALAEGETGIAMAVTEESTVKNEAAENNSSNDQSTEISHVEVADTDQRGGNGEGFDVEHFEQQGNAAIEELLDHAETVCPLAYDGDNQLAESGPGVDADAEVGLENLVEENGLPQNELEDSLQKGEMEHVDIDVSENVEVDILNDEINKSIESEEDSGKNHENHSSEPTPMDVEMETERFQKHHEEDSSISHGNHSSEARLVDEGNETEPNQEYHQEEDVDVETEQLSDEFVPSLKRKALDPVTDGPDKKANFSAANISASTVQSPKPSFKIGECIRRVASQLTGGTSMVVNEISSESSVVDMLSQFQIMALDPSKPYKFRDEIFSFFSGFRNSVVAAKRVRKKKGDVSVGGPAEEFEFDDAKDSYWTDMVVQNNPEKPTLHDNENGEERIQLAVPANGEKLEKSARRPQSRKKRFFTGHIPNTSDGVEDKAKRLKQETSPAELILNFAERKCVPSEINLNKTFRRFGPLMESETEVDYESGRARVIFKRGSDAEVAHSSSQKFSIFGPGLINYQIGYSPLISVKVSPLQIT